MIEFRYFQREDFQEFQSWFADKTLNRELGPLDNEWLHAVLAEEPPGEFIFSRDSHMIAVVGIAYPNEQNARFYITSIAVNPIRRGTGIGRMVIRLLQEHFARTQPDSPRAWTAFVSDTNKQALAFFDRIGWQASSQPDENGMFQVDCEYSPID